MSILLTSCLTAIKNHVIKYCTRVYERNDKNLFWSIKNSGEILNKLKSRGFLPLGLSTYDFSTLYTTLPHNLIKEKLTELIEQTFNREGSLYLASNDKNAFYEKPKRYELWSCQKMCDALLYLLCDALHYLLPGRVAQSVMCLATDACLTAIPGVASSIPAWSHTFVEIDHEII